MIARISQSEQGALLGTQVPGCINTVSVTGHKFLKALISLSELSEVFSIEPHRILPDVMLCMLIFNYPSCSVEEKNSWTRVFQLKSIDPSSVQSEKHGQSIEIINQ